MDLNEIRIDCISDTHNRHERLVLPGGGILVHAGDVSGLGHSEEILPFLDWFAEQNYSHLVLIPGNHDFGFEKERERYVQECKDRNIHLLNDSGVELDGIKVWGSPVQPWFHNWAFNRYRGADIKKHWDMIPEDTEILVTHGPPYGILDECRPGTTRSEKVGCQDLIDKIAKTQVKLHIFGHIHEGRGYRYANGRVYVNGSALDENYSPKEGVPITVVKGIDGTYFVEKES